MPCFYHKMICIYTLSFECAMTFTCILLLTNQPTNFIIYIQMDIHTIALVQNNAYKVNLMEWNSTINNIYCTCAKRPNLT